MFVGQAMKHAGFTPRIDVMERAVERCEREGDAEKVELLGRELQRLQYKVVGAQAKVRLHLHTTVCDVLWLAWLCWLPI
jgi:hypothetical protein